MSLLSFFFKKKKLKVGHWLLVVFSDAAKEYAVGSDNCKKIYQMYDEQWTGESENYTAAKAKIYKRNGSVLLDSTIGQLIPKDSLDIPRTEAAFGTIQLHSRVQT